ncbi:hypothetical protein KPH14_008128 [Odynerus spinipes]|uniref:ribonuclease Z n=1 Tax=Odynerus spinipes TaxID=1348599 RepID=A0AAD9RKD0_9HYME|nr:hypothetical protein KPH14_008128 [Odynerus spinipes]
MSKNKTKSNFIPSNIRLQVLGCGSTGGCTALLLITDHKRWIARRVENMLKILRKSSVMTQLKVSINNIDVVKEYSDNAMTVSCIPVYPNVNDTCKRISETETDSDTCDDDTSKISRKRKHNDNRITKRIKLKQNVAPVVSYICKLHDKLGSLNLEKCIEKGLKPGPIFGLLKTGNDVTLDDGTIVKHEEVCYPREKGATFVVVECPNVNYIESFVNHNAFTKHQKCASNKDDKPFCIVHFTPQEIIDNPKYKDWINSFDPNTYHLIINESNTGWSSEAVYKQQHILNTLHPKIFPLLHSESFQNESNVECQNVNTDNIQQIYHAKTLQTICLRPELKFDTETTLTIDPESYMDELYRLTDFPDALAELRSNINEKMKSLLDIEEYPKFIMLGTASSTPSKIRNTSSILVRIDEDHSILLDCSEGTLTQIVRAYGLSKLNLILATIKVIFVSHLHADHHLGLIAILQQRAKVAKDPIFLLIPDNLRSWLQVYHKFVEPIEDYFKLLSNQDLLIKNHNLPSSVKNELYAQLNVMEINTTLVKHCTLAYAIALVFKNKKKIVYSGDTMPCDDMIKLGENCDLLIHEATLQDELAEEARLKKHSTTSEAIEMGEKMRAGFTLLTHFSQRHAKIPILPKESKADLSKKQKYV